MSIIAIIAAVIAFASLALMIAWAMRNVADEIATPPRRYQIRPEDALPLNGVETFAPSGRRIPFASTLGCKNENPHQPPAA